MFQLKQGLFVEANLKDKDIFVNERCLNAMGNASNVDVIDFLERYRDSLEALAGEPGRGERVTKLGHLHALHAGGIDVDAHAFLVRGTLRLCAAQGRVSAC